MMVRKPEMVIKFGIQMMYNHFYYFRKDNVEDYVIISGRIMLRTMLLFQEGECCGLCCYFRKDNVADFVVISGRIMLKTMLWSRTVGWRLTI